MKITPVKRWTALTILSATLLAGCSTTPHADAIDDDEARVTPQIVGGVTATAGEFPFMVRLGNSPSQQWCGGSLIATNWVLTAAHCMVGESQTGVYATAGDHRISVNEGTEQSRRSTRIFIHPSFNNSTYNNDIALIKVSSAFSLNSRVATTSLRTLPGSGSQLTVIGWGRTREGGSSANTLRKVNVSLQSASSCSGAYPGQTTSNMFCAGEVSGGKDSCQGDSGGPLFTQNAPLRQIGVVSFGSTSCTEIDKPGVYAKVSEFAAWLASNTSTGSGDGALTVNLTGDNNNIGIGVRQSN
ncbi:MAG: serine protease [Pleurocapsa sp. SU_196_0]|nr:serine protease [Pleurocapsa sp. SU_196_0]